MTGRNFEVKTSFFKTRPITSKGRDLCFPQSDARGPNGCHLYLFGFEFSLKLVCKTDGMEINMEINALQLP